MRDYRAYIFGIDGHRFIKASEFLSDHQDDATAMKAAEKLVDGHDVEVWDCGRLVARLSPSGEVMSSPGLVPSLVFAAPSDNDKNSEPPAEPISPSRVSELALDATSASNPFVF